MGWTHIARLTALAGALPAITSCGAEPAPTTPTRDCESVVWALPARSDASVAVIGSWDGWAAPGLPMVPFEGGGPGGGEAAAGWQVARFSPPPGEHGYLVVEEGVSALDDHNPLSTYRGDKEVSLLLAPDCALPELRVDTIEATDSGDVDVRATLLARPGGSPLDPGSVTAKTLGGDPVGIESATPEDGAIVLRATGLLPGKHTLILEAADGDGKRAAARGVAWVKPAQRSWSEGVLYHLVIDRFRGDGGAILDPPAAPGARAGGTLGGVTTEIERGTFEALGVTALWLSPVYLNPEEAREGRDGNFSEGYHGYWPLDSRAVDPRIGGAEALRALVAAAHQRGMRVLLDLVPNHIYEDNPRYAAHKLDGWFNDGPDQCVCGAPGCAWDETCWFTPYLPDLRWQHPDAMRAAVDDTVWWSEEFDIDGLRIDAVPLMPRAATRRMAHALRASSASRADNFIVGEVFTGPGEAGIRQIRYHLGPDGLDSAFDFPLMWAIRGAIASGAGGFDEVEAILRSEDVEFAGSGVVLARILGNHDTTRFVSEANGDAGGDPWVLPPSQPSGELPYVRQRMALALLFTLPGVPTLYYGDEVALAGAGDPDCRRVMPALDGLAANQAAVLEAARRLGKLRACSASLRAGDRIPLVATAETYGFVRDAGDGLPVIALFSTAGAPASIPMLATAVPPGVYVDVISGEEIPISEDGAPASVMVEPRSFRILTPASSPCR